MQGNQRSLGMTFQTIKIVVTIGMHRKTAMVCSRLTIYPAVNQPCPGLVALIVVDQCQAMQLYVRTVLGCCIIAVLSANATYCSDFFV